MKGDGDCVSFRTIIVIIDCNLFIYQFAKALNKVRANGGHCAREIGALNCILLRTTVIFITPIILFILLFPVDKTYVLSKLKELEICYIEK